MSRCSSLAHPLLRILPGNGTIQLAFRPFSMSAARPSDVPPTNTPVDETAAPAVLATFPAASSATTQAQLDPLQLDPNTAIGKEAEQALMKAGTPPVGSRRRRAALRVGLGIPFEQMPYQCFQEARKILKADRELKVEKIKATAAEIERLEKSDGSKFRWGIAGRNLKIKSLKDELSRIQILADINDPAVRRRLEDGEGDMNKPIYRYLANEKWRSYERKIIQQRIEQFNITPDLLPTLDVTADVKLHFHRRKIAPGAFVPSIISELPVRLNVQLFDEGPRMLSIVVVDLDVPDVEADSFRKRCHLLAVNIPHDPTKTSLPLSFIRDPSQLVLPWMPPYAHQGAPYHRLAIVVLEQTGNKPLDTSQFKAIYKNRLGFSLKSFMSKSSTKPIGFNMFRTEWDKTMKDVMERHGYEGTDIVYRRLRVRSLKPPQKARGWEAKRQGPKYRHLWKYTKRIRGLSNARGWIKRG